MPHGVRRTVRALALGAALIALAPPLLRADGPLTPQTIDPGTLKVCLYAGFAPFAYKDADGDWQGWDYEYLQGFAAALHLNFEVVEVEKFEGIWLRPGAPVAEACDIAATGISDTAERRANTRGKGCWSSTYYHVLRTFLVRIPDYARLADIAGLAGRTVIVTKGSTAHLDVCSRMEDAKMQPCKKDDGDHPCSGLTESQDKTTCVQIEYPRCDDEANGAADVAANKGGSFAYGGGYGSIQTQVCRLKGLALVWPHCNMVKYEGKNRPYAEPFSFVVRQKDTGLLAALNRYLANQVKPLHKPYKGTAIPDLGCAEPPWTKETDEGCKP